MLVLGLLLALVNPRSIHYSANGDYLVDQDGHRTAINGHPRMVCHQKTAELRGTFISASGAKIMLKTTRGEFLIHYPICDLYE